MGIFQLSSSLWLWPAWPGIAGRLQPSSPRSSWWCLWASVSIWCYCHPSFAVGLLLDIFSWLLTFSLEKRYGGMRCSPNERETLPCCLMIQQAAEANWSSFIWSFLTLWPALELVFGSCHSPTICFCRLTKLGGWICRSFLESWSTVLTYCSLCKNNFHWIFKGFFSDFHKDNDHDIAKNNVVYIS